MKSGWVWRGFMRAKSAPRMLLFVFCAASLLAATNPQEKPASQEPRRPGVDGNLAVTVGMSMIIDSPAPVLKIAIANGDLAEAVAISPKEVLINGRAPGETSLIVWQQGGARLVYDLTVRISSRKLDAARQQIAREFPDEDISVTFENDTAFVRGTVKNEYEAGRVMAIATSLGKAVNLLNVTVPAEPAQILLKVRFADVDRSTTTSLGFNFMSNAFNQTTGISTGQFGSSGADPTGAGTFNLASALNVLLLRKDINIGVTIQALEAKNLLQMLAEPNVMATSGKEANFTDGGEIPIPILQSSLTPGAVTIQYRPYGVQLHFLPEVTPRGTIHLQVTPEVSAPDYSNAVSVAGTTVPGFTTKRVQTEVELESGQSFVIAGLLDNQITETLNKIPGLANLPILGKLFQSRQKAKSDSELLVIVTPELVRPVPADQKTPMLNFPSPWLEPNSTIPLRQPGMDKTGPVPVHPAIPSMPFEQLMEQMQKQKQQTQNAPQAPQAPTGAPPAATPQTPPTGVGSSTPAGNGGTGN